MAKLYNCKIENFIEKQYVEKQEVKDMHVQNQIMPKEGVTQVQGDDESKNTLDPLYLHLNDENVYHEVVKRLNICEKPEHIREWVCKYIKEKLPNGKALIIGIDFVNYIIPHLTNYNQSKNAKTIQNSII